MRQTTRILARCCAALLFGVATVAAQGPSTPPAGSGATAPGSSWKPFSQLFGPRADAEVARRNLEFAVDTLKAVRPGSARRFICRTPVLVPDPTLDRSLVVPPPSTGTWFTMRTGPPSCH